jgi:hypothetical protein
LNLKGIRMEKGLQQTSSGDPKREAGSLLGFLEDNPGVNDAHTDVVNDDRV